jgi:TPR repeat protein
MPGAYERATRLAQARKEKGLPQTKKVYELLLEAERRGDARAVYALATWHLHGSEFTKINIRRATSMLRKAADGNVADANYDLAVSYEKGVGLKKSPQRAFEHYTKAALLGDAQSYVEVWRMLYWGIGTARNRRLARIWRDRAEALGAKLD